MLLEKLLSGKLKKHSEQLNKFIAGFFDTDGSVFIYRDRGTITMRSSISQAASSDPDFEIMRALQKHYRMGRIVYYFNSYGTSACHWNLNTKESAKLFNLIGKHLNVKATYFQTCLAIRKENLKLSASQYKDLQCMMKLDRANSKYLKKPKHLAWAYTAGVLAGDGHLRCKSFIRKDRPQHACNRLDVMIELADKVLIDLFQESFKGSVNKHTVHDWWRWQRGLGKMNKKFAIKFIKKIRKYMLLKTKRDVLDRMLAFHDSYPQRLNKLEVNT
jgi:hypothetical protein